MTRATRALLGAAVAAPLLYFGTVFVAALFYPGYSHATQYASELGSAQARYPLIFNTGVFVAGLACIAAGAGFARAVLALGGTRALGMLGGLAVSLFGASLLMGALFPMPDPRHGGFGLGMAIQLAPFFLAGAFWKQPAYRGFSTFLTMAGVAMLVMFAVMMGVGGLVRRANVGIYQRVYALTTFPWVGVAGYLLRRTMPATR